ncbi:type IX secretion system protein PorD [Wenyingzhuangia sp. IMCC45533]
MFKKLFISFFLLVFTVVNAQELNCNVTVNADQISVSNNQIFKTLENSLSELINQTQWTKIDFEEHERIKCAITVIITEQSGTNNFRGSIQIQASRPVFNSTYYTPILNHKDDKFSFNYIEFQPLNYNRNGFESNLISVISYYSYVIIGLYLDTFSLDGGERHLQTALTIANQAQQSGSTGWENARNEVTRFTLVDQLLALENEPFRKTLYSYHYDSMDVFERNQKTAATKLLRSLLTFKDIYNANPNNILIRSFMDAKSDEIINIFRKNRGIDTTELIAVLKKVSANNSKKWKQIYSN